MYKLLVTVVITNTMSGGFNHVSQEVVELDSRATADCAYDNLLNNRLPNPAPSVMAISRNVVKLY